ncbi:MAG: hypothetical protein JXA13_13115 [Anaerolineales bacterium]|nr:hypothetical protein [Anaerolineales bacterium]
MRISTFSKSLLLGSIVLGSIVLLTTGCHPSDPKFPTGDYIDTEGNLTSFHSDGQMWIRNLNTGEILATHSKYSVDGDTITFASIELCPQGDGVYKWTQDGDRLLFELIEDQCDFRIWKLSLEITRYKYGE